MLIQNDSLAKVVFFICKIFHYIIDKVQPILYDIVSFDYRRALL